MHFQHEIISKCCVDGLIITCFQFVSTVPPLFITGLKKFLQLGIPADKLVLGLPWYGYDYPCLHYTKVRECYYRITLAKQYFRFGLSRH